jgi:uncharacterized membrane protein (UPF0182 family)
MGSRVIRGNLMVIPIKNSIIYVEPIYLQATQSKLPELKRVVLSYGDSVVMTQSLDEAVDAVFRSVRPAPDESGATKEKAPETDRRLLEKLRSQIRGLEEVVNELLHSRGKK